MKSTPKLIRSYCLTASFICALSFSVLAQTPLVLFQDGFEQGTPGLSPGANQPIVGTYILSDGTSPYLPVVPATNTMRIVTGPFPGGPDGAYSGTNYFMLDRIDFQTANPVLQAVFVSGLLAANTPFHAELRLWATHLTGDNNYPQLIIGGNGNGNPIATSANTHFLYTSDVTRSAQWQWYNGSYTDSGLRFSAGAWDLVEMDWDGTNMTGRINGVSAPLGLYGGADKLIDRMLIRTGLAQTQFFVDDVKVTTTGAVLLKSLLPGPNATGVGRQPTIEVQLADGSKSVATGSIQLFFDNTQVTPRITQGIKDGLNVTTISYVPPALAYGSVHTNRIVYADQPAPANQYSKEWKFTVYTGDLIFADSYESALPVKTSAHYFNAFEGSNCLSVARLVATGRPILEGAGDKNQTSADGDTIQITLAYAPWSSGWQVGTLAVIPGYATETNTFVQTGQINLASDGRVSVVDLGGTLNQYLTARMTTNQWNTITIQYVNGSAQWNVSVNGSPFETYFGKSSQGGSAYGNVNGVRLASANNGSTWCDALVVSNLTANTLLFKDGFENTARGALPGTNSPTVGTYLTLDLGGVAGGLLVSDGEVWDYPPPNGPQMGTYDANTTTARVWSGTGHGGNRCVNLFQGALEANFITTIPAGVLVHAEAWFNWQAGQVSWGYNAGEASQFAKVTFKEDNSITLFDGSTEAITGLTRTNGGWQRSELDYVVGASTIIVRHNGTAKTLPITPVSLINGLFFVENDALSSKAYVDDLRATALLGNAPATSPQLTAVRSGNQLTLSWTNGPGYYLQVNTDATNPNGWAIVPGGGASPVQVTIGVGGFYRLVKPL